MKNIKVNKTDKKTLYKCIPVDFLWLPIQIRKIIGIITIVLFCWLFFTVPIAVLYTLYLIYYQQVTITSGVFYGSIIISLLTPMREWPVIRKVGQFWYEVFDFSCNLDPTSLDEFIESATDHQYVISMHPHGIIPLQAILWASYCDQYLRSSVTGHQMYGFGAIADILMYLPFLRNISGWLSGGSASYKALMDGIGKGIAPSVNNAGRIPKNLYILPGGIAEIFTSTPGKHTVVFQNRRGLVKLSLETGALLMPTYVFGGTDFFDNLATSDSWISHLCRKLKIGITIFWGPYYLPIPYFPKVSMCIADPIIVEKWKGDGPVPNKTIEELHDKYVEVLTKLFDDHKAIAGHPNAKLEVI